jgi:hypothetical protein
LIQKRELPGSRIKVVEGDAIVGIETCTSTALAWIDLSEVRRSAKVVRRDIRATTIPRLIDLSRGAGDNLK